MKDMGLVSYMLGLEIKMNKKRKLLTIVQEKYVKDLLVQFELETLKPISIHMDPSNKLIKESCPQPNSLEFKEMQHKPYREIVGALMYLAVLQDQISLMRLVKLPALCVILEWRIGKRLFKYPVFLIETADFGLHFDGNAKDGEQDNGYSDADWGGDVDTRRSKKDTQLFL
jgi:hypothetical protein